MSTATNSRASGKAKPTPSPARAGSKSKGTGTSKAKSSSARAEANRRNAQKSTGPRTAEGKARARFNALKHGMTARSPVLPEEDAGELLARQRELIVDLQPRNLTEAVVAARLGEDLWRADRANRAADTRINERVRHEPLQQAAAESDRGGRAWRTAVLATVVAVTDQPALGNR